MGLKDSVTKDYMRDNIVFADAFNYFLYGGEAVIDPKSLVEMDSTELVVPYYNDDNKGMQTESEQKYRDALKSTTVMYNDKATYMILGVENQTDINYAMPVKNIVYDVLQYGRQVTDLARKHRKVWASEHPGKKPKSEEFLSGIYKEDRLTPVITLVIHFGDSKWDGPMSLREMMATTDKQILSYVPDYKINLLEPAQMTTEEMGKFQSTLREVFRFIKYSKDGEKLGKYLQSEERLKHLEVGAAKVIKVITGSKFDIPEGVEVVDVCQAERELINKAKEEAQDKGVDLGKLETTIKYVRKGRVSTEEAAEDLNMTVEEFVEKMNQFLATAEAKN